MIDFPILGYEQVLGDMPGVNLVEKLAADKYYPMDQAGARL